MIYGENISPGKEARKLHLHARIGKQKLYFNNTVISKFGRIAQEVTETFILRKKNFEKLSSMIPIQNDQPIKLKTIKLPRSTEIKLKSTSSSFDVYISESDFDDEVDQIRIFEENKFERSPEKKYKDDIKPNDSAFSDAQSHLNSKVTKSSKINEPGLKVIRFGFNFVKIRASYKNNDNFYEQKNSTKDESLIGNSVFELN